MKYSLRYLILLYVTLSISPNYAQIFWADCWNSMPCDVYIKFGDLYSTVHYAQVNVLSRSTDDCNSWSPLHQFASGFSVVVLNDSGHIFVGHDLGVYRSTDDGNSWINTGLSNLERKSLALSPDGDIFVGCNPLYVMGGVYRSTNNGNDWENTSLTVDVTCIAINSNGWIYAGSHSGIFMSSDSGNNWIAMNTNLTNLLVSSIFIDSSDDILVGTYEGGVFKSSDNGNNWINISIGISTSWVFSIVTNSVGYIFAATYGEGIFRSADNGNTWSPVNSGLNSLQTTDLARNSNDIIFVGTYAGVYRSINSTTPVELKSFTGLAKEDKVILRWSTASETNNHGFKIQRSLNKLDWATVGYKEGYGTTTEEHKYQFTDNLHAINANKLYYRLKQVDLNGNSKYSYVIEVGIAPQEFELYQNYPNPFNPTTHIEFAIPHPDFVTLKVYDVLGNEIKTLVNEEKPSGRYNLKFDGSNLASGIYFYKMHTGSFSNIKKFILIK